MSNIPYKTYLTEQELPRAWYNVRADMKTDHRPIINPATGKPAVKEDLRPVFCEESAGKLGKLFPGRQISGPMGGGDER